MVLREGALAEILLLSNKDKRLKPLFKEPPNQSAHEAPEDIFYEPAHLLKACDLKDVLNDEPFKYIMTAGGVWEFYLLRYAKNIGRREYGKLIKRIPDSKYAISGYSKRKLGNPYDVWPNNYSEEKIDNSELRRASEPFANKLVSRGCPVRQKGSNSFIKKRRRAAQAFFNYLIGGKITKKLFEKLKDCESIQKALLLLIKKYPQNDLFITSGLMTCLYGGRNVDWIDAKLANAVAIAMKRKPASPIIMDVCNILISKKNYKSFKPPFKDIYDVRGEARERVNINFRIQTWLKLLKDTLIASK